MLKYKTLPFTAEVSVSGGRIDFDAVFSLSAPDGAGKRDFSAEFLSPESLKGLTLVQSGGEMKILLGGKEFLSEKNEILRHLDIGKIADMLAPDGAVRSIKSEGGLTAVSIGNVIVYIDPASSLPVKIIDKESNMVIWVRGIK